MSFFSNLTKAAFLPYSIAVDVVTFGTLKATSSMFKEVDELFELTDFMRGVGPEFVRHRAEDGVKDMQEKVDVLEEHLDELRARIYKLENNGR